MPAGRRPPPPPPGLIPDDPAPPPLPSRPQPQPNTRQTSPKPPALPNRNIHQPLGDPPESLSDNEDGLYEPMDEPEQRQIPQEPAESGSTVRKLTESFRGILGKKFAQRGHFTDLKPVEPPMPPIPPIKPRKKPADEVANYKPSDDTYVMPVDQSEPTSTFCVDDSSSEDNIWPGEFSDGDVEDDVVSEPSGEKSSSPAPPLLPPRPKKNSISKTQPTSGNRWDSCSDETQDDMYELPANPPTPDRSATSSPSRKISKGSRKNSTEKKKTAPLPDIPPIPSKEEQDSETPTPHVHSISNSFKDTLIMFNPGGKPKPPLIQRKPPLPEKPGKSGSRTAEPLVVKPNVMPLPEVPKPNKQDSDDNNSNESFSSGSGGQIQPHGSQGPALLPHKPVDSLINKVRVLPVSFSPDVPLKPTKHETQQPAGGVSPSHAKIPLPPVPVTNEEPSDIYDDGMSEKLIDFPWFHGQIDRTEGKRRLKGLNMDGAFLVRYGSQTKYVLMVSLNDKDYNLKIRERTQDNLFAIGDPKEDEVTFKSVPDLIEHHKKHNVTVFEKGVARSVKFTKTPSKP